MSLEDQIYTHMADTGEPISLNITQVNAWLDAPGRKVGVLPITTTLDPAYADKLRRQGTVEEGRLATMVAADLDKPLVGLWMGPDLVLAKVMLDVMEGKVRDGGMLNGGTVVIADGNHRYVKRCELGLLHTKMNILSRFVWQQFSLNWPKELVEILSPEVA